MLIIGLTGGIAAGKTSVAKMFKKRGARIIDADRIGHEIIKPKTETWQKIVDSFGREILNRNLTVNRGKLGKMVFADPRLLKKLNRLMHPAMTRVIKNEIAKLTLSPSLPLLILDAAVLFEADWSSLIDKVIVVKASRQNQLRRLKKYKNLSGGEARQRIACQVSREKEMKKADYLIENNGPLRKTEEKAGEIWFHLTKQKKYVII
jgi:dephospho-CoA kinase